MTVDTAVLPAEFVSEPRRGLPAWLLSVVMHATLFLAIGLLAPPTANPPPGDSERAVGIALVARSPSNQAQYFTERSAGARSLAAPAGATAIPGLPNLDSVSSAAGIRLPIAGERGSTAGSAIGIADASGLTAGGPGRGPSKVGGQTRTQVFGAQGQGSNFVYVFDRSSSMGGFGGRPMQAAKAELRQSLQDLATGNQFQIVFYNEQPAIFNPFRPNPPKMFFATDENKDLAREYAQSITPAGGTAHVAALEFALRMGPDVIFFLTDAGEPQLTAREIADLQRKNRAASIINTIEFGAGPFQGGENFLIRLARLNLGQHVYVDVTKLPDAR